MFKFSDQRMLSLFKMGGYVPNKNELATWLTRDGEADFVLCPDDKMARFLNGLIIKNRGARDDGIPEPEKTLNNNIILRKLKIALDLQADDLIKLLKLNGFTISKHELSALFRRPDHKNYRLCLDQLLRNILDGMEKHYRKKQAL